MPELRQKKDQRHHIRRVVGKVESQPRREPWGNNAASQCGIEKGRGSDGIGWETVLNVSDAVQRPCMHHSRTCRTKMAWRGSTTQCNTNTYWAEEPKRTDGEVEPFPLRTALVVINIATHIPLFLERRPRGEEEDREGCRCH